MSVTTLNSIDHFVVVMLENRSFDHLLGFLYADNGGRGLKEQPFEGLTGKERNTDDSGHAHEVTKLQPADEFCYFTPRADPGEGFSNTSAQLYGDHMVVAQETPPTNEGFVKNYQYTSGWEQKAAHYTVYEGAQPSGIIAMHTPATLPVLSTLAQNTPSVTNGFARSLRRLSATEPLCIWPPPRASSRTTGSTSLPPRRHLWFAE